MDLKISCERRQIRFRQVFIVYCELKCNGLTDKEISMKLTKIIVMLLCCVMVVSVASGKTDKPTTIQSGTLVDSSGNTITTGYDDWGYNYQAHVFNGLYENYSRPATVVTVGDENLVMKWSDNWLSNVDFSGDK